MSEDGLPSWYVLRKGKVSILPEQLVEEGKKRIDLLVGLDNIEVKDLIKELSGDYAFVGHIALRITAALGNNKPFTNWFLEREADLFDKIFHSLPSKEVKLIIFDLFKKNILWGLNDIMKKLFHNSTGEEIRLDVSSSIPKELLRKIRFIGDEDLIAVKFEYVPSLVRRRIGLLHKGWLILPLGLLKWEIKRIFQNELSHRVKKLEEMKETDERYDVFKAVSEWILDYWKSKRVPFRTTLEDLSFKGGKLYKLEKFFPPCMRILMNKLRATGYLNHGERLQLGLFLKRLGMTLEEQLQFWYQIAVDNVGLSWDEFDKKAGYIIRHIYGKVGSMKDYEVPKCETIIKKYFCPFEAFNAEELKQNLNSIESIDDDTYNRIISFVKEQKYQSACSVFLSKLIKRRYNKPMSHPLLFFRIMFKMHKKNNKDSDKNRDINEKGEVHEGKQERKNA
ncbi:MAG: hypothetical protein ACP6IP_08560 [Candidatus Njordarchaeia archaeon]